MPGPVRAKPTETKETKVITVLGATGAQGGAVVDALLATSLFKVRGVTRDVKSAQAEALAKKGVEVVAGNVLKPETIKDALKGSYGFFAVTNFWDKEQMGKEVEIGKSLVDAAKESKVTHFIWSTLVDTAAESKDQYRVPHFTHKAKVEEYARSAGFPYHTYVAAPYYYQNWGTFISPTKKEDGSYIFTFPIPDTTTFTQGDVQEFGIVVASAFRNPKGWGHGEFIAAAGEHSTLADVLKIFSQHLGVEVKLNQVSKEDYSKLYPGASEVAEMLEWFKEYGYYGRNRDIYSGNKAKGTALKTLAEYLKEVSFAFKS